MAARKRWPMTVAGIVLAAVTTTPAVAQDDSNTSAGRSVTGSVVPASGSTFATPATTGQSFSGGPTTLWDHWKARRAGANPSELNAPIATEDCCPTSRLTLWERWKWHRSQHKQHMQDSFMGYPEEFEEPPLGASLYAHAKTQIANGEAARMVLYHYDFAQGNDQLNRRGRDQLDKIAKLLPCSFSPVVIERSENPQLDDRRKQAVLSELNRGAFPVPAERVVVDLPIANGLNGKEAVRVEQNLMKQTEARGRGMGELSTGGQPGGGGGAQSGGGAGATGVSSGSGY